MAGITSVSMLALNFQWPGFASTRLKADPWSKRLPALVKSVGSSGADLVFAQELGDDDRDGQARQVFDRKGWGYSSHILNAVGWDTVRFEHEQTERLTLPDGGQGPGRSCICVTLRERETGNLVRGASLHLAVKTNSPPVSERQAQDLRAVQMQKIVSWLNNATDDIPIFLGGDFNSRATDLFARSPRTIAKGYGWRWLPTFTGIDMVMSNFGAVTTKRTKIEMGTATDHDGHLVVGHTTSRR